MELKQRSERLSSCLFFTPRLSTLWLTILFVAATTADAAPVLDKAQFHAWDVVETYLNLGSGKPPLLRCVGREGFQLSHSTLTYGKDASEASSGSG